MAHAARRCAVLAMALSLGSMAGAWAQTPGSTSPDGPLRYEGATLPDTLVLGEATVRAGKEKYSRKNNPAVELMRHVIEAKEDADWTRRHEYTSVEKYTKLVFALNDVSERTLQENGFSRMPFLPQHVEVCNATGKRILPTTINEKLTQRITRHYGAEQRDIVMGENHTGLDELLEVGDITEAGLNDFFTDINILDDDVRLLQHQITSPLSRRTALSFYQYFIEDTLTIDSLRLYEVSFRPRNRQDFGFSGSMLIAGDSTYRVHYATLIMPRGTGFNWIESMRLTQSFMTLPSGEHVLQSSDMILELRIVEKIQKFMARRTTTYSKFSTSELPSPLFRKKGKEVAVQGADERGLAFWTLHRPSPLTEAEERIGDFKRNLLNIRGLKPILWIVRAFVNNSIPLTFDPTKTAKVDITPVNTFISSNPVDGLRLRLSARTTAALMPHLFLRGYAAYGFKDKKWKGLGEVTYAFNRPDYTPAEFPAHNLTFTYQRDLMAPSDLFLNTDKDNVFTSLKWAKTEHMMYFEKFRLLYEKEWLTGLRLQLQLRREKDSPAGELRYAWPDSTLAPSLTLADVTIGLRYKPGATYINSKQARHTLNEDAPIYALSHTTGIKGVWGSQYRYNITEAELYRRFQLNSWGRLDIDVKGGVQWNRVPFPLLLMPASNLSYIKQKNTFALVNNMEFLNDRYASCMVAWDMGGKLFNRVPLLRKLKLREFFGVNVLWGTLTKKNNPAYRSSAEGEACGVMLFPTTSSVMDTGKPYVEGIVGIHNILKVLHVEYVHRFTYTDLPTSQRWGIRFRIDLGF